MLPHLIAAEDVVYLFALELRPGGHLQTSEYAATASKRRATDLFRDRELIRAGIARPFVVARLVRDNEHVGACWTEEHCTGTATPLLSFAAHAMPRRYSPLNRPLLSMSELVCKTLDHDATDVLIDKWLENRNDAYWCVLPPHPQAHV